MNHSDIQSRMQAYLDGELSLDKRALFDAHLDTCDGCSAELTEMRETIRLLRNLPTPEPPSDFVANVMQRIEEGEGQPGWLAALVDRLHPLFVPRFAIPATAAAAALGLTVLSGNLELPGAQPGATAPAASFASLDAVPQTLRATEARVANPVRVAQASPPARQASAETVRVASPTPPVRYGGNTGAGSFLARVAGDQLGPMRREANTGGAQARVFLMSDMGQLGPVVGASAAPSIALGTGSIHTTGADRGALDLASRPRIHPVSVSRLDAVPVVGEDSSTPEERRNRELDMRLNALINDPPGFAQMQSRATPVEQDLWMTELAARAEELGDVERVLAALEGSGDAGASQLATAFSNAVAQNRAAWAAAEAAQ